MFKQMKADGVDVIGFGAGEPDFNTPDNIKAAGIAAIEQNVTRYTPAAGTVELRQAVCGRMKADYGLEYKPSQVVVSSGASTWSTWLCGQWSTPVTRSFCRRLLGELH